MLTLWHHPFSSFCRKAVIALEECGADYDTVLVDLGDERSRADFLAIWPMGQFPVLRDEASGELMPESTIIIEYLADRFPQAGLIPRDPAAARRCRLTDRFFDNHIHVPMQRIVSDYLRPADQRYPIGVEQARARIRRAYPVAESLLAEGPWAMGEDFTLADCSAWPALHFAARVEPWQGAPKLDAYCERLAARPSIRRTTDAAAPYEASFPVR